MVEAGPGGTVTVGYMNAGTFTPADGQHASQAIQITKARTAGLADFAQGEATPLIGEIAVFVDYYLDKKATSVDELQIAADNFAGNYYVEADTLFRRKSDGVDMPANLTFPNVKIQSNLTFSLSGTGDPSTFTFTMDALPGYIEDQTNADKVINPVMPHNQSLEHDADEIDDTHYIGFGTEANTTKGNAVIDITGEASTVAVEGTLSLTGTSIPGGATITWASSDTTKATVSNGTVTGVAPGKVTITASAEGYKTGSYDITVTAAG